MKGVKLMVEGGGNHVWDKLNPGLNAAGMQMTSWSGEKQETETEKDEALSSPVMKWRYARLILQFRVSVCICMYLSVHCV